MHPLSSKESLQGVISDCLAAEASGGVGMGSAGGQAQCWSEAESRKGSGTASLWSAWVVCSGLEDRRGLMMSSSICSWCGWSLYTQPCLIS